MALVWLSFAIRCLSDIAACHDGRGACLSVAVPQGACSLYHITLTIALKVLTAGFVAALLMAVIGIWRARLTGIGCDIIAAPIYWLLISIAGYRALIQIIWWPHLWEKTEHSARRR